MVVNKLGDYRYAAAAICGMLFLGLQPAFAHPAEILHMPQPVEIPKTVSKHKLLKRGNGAAFRLATSMQNTARSLVQHRPMTGWSEKLALAMHHPMVAHSQLVMAPVKMDEQAKTCAVNTVVAEAVPGSKGQPNGDGLAVAQTMFLRAKKLLGKRRFYTGPEICKLIIKEGGYATKREYKPLNLHDPVIAQAVYAVTNVFLDGGTMVPISLEKACIFHASDLPVIHKKGWRLLGQAVVPKGRSGNMFYAVQNGPC